MSNVRRNLKSPRADRQSYTLPAVDRHQPVDEVRAPVQSPQSSQHPQYYVSARTKLINGRILREARESGSPTSCSGIFFWRTEADSLVPSNVNMAKHYYSPKVGNAFSLTPDQIERIKAIINESFEQPIDTGLDNLEFIPRRERSQPPPRRQDSQ